MIDLQALPYRTVAQRNLLPSIPAVYIVADSDTVLYVGSSNNVRVRWTRTNHHRTIQFRDHHRIYWIEAEASGLLSLEKEAIRELSPSLNGTKIDDFCHASLTTDVQNQLKELILALNVDQVSVINRAIAQLWQREVGEPDRNLATEVDALAARLAHLEAAQAAKE